MKTAQEIYEQMLTVFTAKTGRTVSRDSDLAVRLYAAAAQLETLYAYGDWVLAQSFPQTAVAEQLDCHAALRGLERRGAVKAQGTLEFSVSESRREALTVPAGTVCTTAQLVRFVTTEDGTIEAGSLSCRVPAVAESAGEDGCVAADTITLMPSPPVGVEFCTNPTPFAGGEAAEDDDSLRQRILQSFVRLPNGANAAFYAERALMDERVSGVQVLPRRRGIGTVDVVIAAEEAARADLQATLSDVREIGTDVQVLLPQERPVNVAVTLWPKSGVTFADAAAAARQALQSCFTGALLGRAVYPAVLCSAVYATGRAENVELTLPDSTVAAEDGVLPVLGEVAVTEGA